MGRYDPAVSTWHQAQHEAGALHGLLTPVLDASTNWLREASPIVQALVATLGTWVLTAIGACAIVVVRSPSRRVLDGSLGFAAGVMVAASCWSLLIPSIEYGGVWRALIGLLAGGLVLLAIDKSLPHRHAGRAGPGWREGRSVALQRTMLLVLAITLHNAPEGLAVGVAFGSGDAGAAAVLALGIGLQNVPEGLAVAAPLRREGMTPLRAAWYGQLTAIVEPVAGVLGAALVTWMEAVLPYGLAFAAGAMLYVVVEELIPEPGRTGHSDVATIGFLLGFAVMMALDTALVAT